MRPRSEIESDAMNGVLVEPLILEVLLDLRDQLQEHALTDAEKLKKLLIEERFHGEPK